MPTKLGSRSNSIQYSLLRALKTNQCILASFTHLVTPLSLSSFLSLVLDLPSTGVDCGNYLVGSPLLQMMVFHDARPGATPLSLEILRFFVEENRSVLSRIISTNDKYVESYS